MWGTLHVKNVERNGGGWGGEIYVNEEGGKMCRENEVTIWGKDEKRKKRRKKKKVTSHAGNRTPATAVRAPDPNH